ncbi:pyruvate:ferredoxin (flavodoxin) oxidoreductase [uncultured Pseudoramibacter sp.]|uniref:pyruvate:ferredoxin (flavodoxin) oxidoreductase n=1 Tax=uncultured Pseudoramibacter sp. TaxID=1623493 RepID=UPI0025CD5622|nr:pyruvate:ferredoxin (flavodoxin) oxidoreductase [uncultured Pseudoramibacter sp.]
MSKCRQKSMDGNTAAAYASYAFTDVAAIYPITPSSDMAQHVDEWAAAGKKNIFGEKVEVIEMQSEGGASGAVHGSLQAGALTSTYTSSQGLMLMIPNMFKIAGELLPGVFHVASRLVASNGLGIFCDHSDVLATRSTGFALLSSASVQQVMDLGAVAHLAAIKGRVPFMHFFDGFRTSHEIQKIEVLEYDELKDLVDMDAVNRFRRNALNPDHPCVRGTVQNADIHFQQREVINRYWDELPDVVDHYMSEITKLTGREYHPFNYYGAPDADRVIIAMGSMTQTIEEVVDKLNAKGEKVGVVVVHLYRPFSLKYFFKAIPGTVRKITVLDRVKEINAQSEPLYMDVKTAFYGRDNEPQIVGGRIGIGGKDIRPQHIFDVFENMKQDEPKDHFTVGIIDDMNGTSLPAAAPFEIAHPGTTACKFWGLGSDGTVGANKSAVKIIGDNTDKFAQAYFAYDSKKSGGVTVSHLRFGDTPIRSTYLIDNADYISCSQQSYVDKYDLLEGLKPGAIFLLNTIWNDDELEANIPAKMKQYIAKNDIQFYTIDAVDIAKEIGLGNRTNMIMQSAFFKLADIIPIDDAVKYLKDSVAVTYGKKGDDVVAMNCDAIDAGIEKLHKVDVPVAWKDATDAPKKDDDKDVPDYIKTFLEPVNGLKGDDIPVSRMIPMEDGTYPVGSSAYEKRGVAITVPHWDASKCIQCNQCAFVCPHGCIRPTLTTAAEEASAPEGYETVPARGAKEYSYRINVSTLDCTGCGNCVAVCPAKEKALDMRLLSDEAAQVPIWDYAVNLPEKANPFDKFTVKGSQFEKPLFEFSGACAGCGETPYIKLLTQLFGDRMMVANSAGCAHVFSGSVPSAPYTTDQKGHGPAWNSSLFEDTAEFGLGMFLGTKQLQKEMASQAKRALDLDILDDLREALKDWLDHQNETEGTRERAEKLSAALEPVKDQDPILTDLYENRDCFTKRSQWLIGGDGWSYDIGYGGLDHALAAGENINALVLDTEVYSNTGGQASKSTPTAAVAKFAAGGKRTRKKDLGRMFMSYGYIYVAQICIGSDKSQAIKALKEAEAYPGPSIVIAYCPCINHGIKHGGMATSQTEAKRAVDCGYWSLYRYNPALADQGANPFTLDSKEPTGDFRAFLMNEVRFASLMKVFPDQAEELFNKTEADAKRRRDYYKQLAQK